jgi:uncharacterized protein HemX
MSDSNKDPTVKQPRQNKVPKLEDFKGVLGWVEKKKEESKASGKPWGWVMGLVAALIVFVALAFAAYAMWKKGQEIAKLKHKIDVDEELKKQAKITEKLQANDIRRAELEKEAADLQNSIDGTKKKVAKIEAERKKEQAKIDKITNWEDVDRLLNK